MISTPVQCDFCEEFSGSSTNSFRRIYNGKPETRILFRSDQFAVMPSLGQITEGYLLLLPHEHFRALGDLPTSSLEELSDVSKQIAEVLNQEYGPHVLFEHGTRSEGVGGCGIYHAHLHATPIGPVSDPVHALKETFPYEQFTEFEEIKERTAGLSSYLLYRDTHGTFYVFKTGPLPSQYMRKMLADAIGEQVWNWRDVRKEERLLVTMQRLSGHFLRLGKLGGPLQPLDASR